MPQPGDGDRTVGVPGRSRAIAADDHVFVYRHRPLSRTYCGKRLHSLGAKCSVHVTPHRLRTSFATLLLNARRLSADGAGFVGAQAHGYDDALREGV